MWTMSSARDSNWSPQPPNRQPLEKKEAAAMPVMVIVGPRVVRSPGAGAVGGGRWGCGAAGSGVWERAGNGWSSRRPEARQTDRQTGRQTDRQTGQRRRAQLGEEGAGQEEEVEEEEVEERRLRHISALPVGFGATDLC